MKGRLGAEGTDSQRRQKPSTHTCLNGPKNLALQPPSPEHHLQPSQPPFSTEKLHQPSQPPPPHPRRSTYRRTNTETCEQPQANPPCAHHKTPTRRPRSPESCDPAKTIRRRSRRFADSPQILSVLRDAQVEHGIPWLSGLERRFGRSRGVVSYYTVSY